MQLFEQATVAEAQKLIVRHERYARRLADEFNRRQRRTTASLPKPQVHRPFYWTLADGFNPYLVRARGSRIAHAVQRAVATRTYQPRNAVRYEVPKDDGSQRVVSVFQVVDAAVSRLFYGSLMKRNRAKLSARSYAYRGDLTIHDAIQYIHAELDGTGRCFIAEFDFTNFFESISHDRIWAVLKNEKFLVTPEEEHVIERFLTVPRVPQSAYHELGGPTRGKGVPLGAALSLFLANVAAWPLDRRLERLGVGYVRYADDTLLWSNSYDRLVAAVDALNEEVQQIGTSLSFSKSKGIRILTAPVADTEMVATDHFLFVGHQFKHQGDPRNTVTMTMSERKIKAFKARVDQLTNFNLLHELRAGTQEASRLGRLDRDYVTLIWQLRRLIYGRLSERDLRRMLAGNIHPSRLSGMLSYYPLVDDDQSLIELDSWLATKIWKALRRRGHLLSAARLPRPPPHGESRETLIRYQYTSRSTGGTLDLRIPSLRRMSELTRRAARLHGPNAIARLDPSGY